MGALRALKEQIVDEESPLRTSSIGMYLTETTLEEVDLKEDEIKLMDEYVETEALRALYNASNACKLLVDTHHGIDPCPGDSLAALAPLALWALA